MTEEINNEITDEKKEPIIGKYNLPGVIGFSSISGNIKINAEDAFINGGQLSGMLDHLVFKITIRDNETIDFEEVDTNETTEELRGRLLNAFLDSEPIVGKLGGMYNPSLFTFISTIESKLTKKQIPLVLLTKYKSPIDMLGEIALETPLVINDDEKKSINDFMSSLMDDEDVKIPNLTEEIISVEDVVMPDTQSTIASEEEMEKMKVINRDKLGKAILESNEYVVAELTKQVNRKTNDLLEIDKRKTIITEEILDLNNRIDAIGRVIVQNGMLFCVSEEIPNDNSQYSVSKEFIDILKEKLKKVQGVNVDAFIKLFETSKYIITIGDSNGEMLTDETKKLELPKDVHFEDGKFIYTGELKWHGIVDEMLNLGYSQDAEFNKKSGSNSYVFLETLNPELPIPQSIPQGNSILKGEPSLEKSPFEMFIKKVISKVKSLF